MELCWRPFISLKGDDAPMDMYLESDADIAQVTINARERRVCTNN
jgi:hypothetical protein